MRRPFRLREAYGATGRLGSATASGIFHLHASLSFLGTALTFARLQIAELRMQLAIQNQRNLTAETFC
jgi:hypothetical protein